MVGNENRMRHDYDSLAVDMQAGDERAASELFTGIYPYVAGIATRFYPSNSMAQDEVIGATIENITRAIMSPNGGYQATGQFTAWAGRVAANAALTYHRRNSRVISSLGDPATAHIVEQLHAVPSAETWVVDDMDTPPAERIRALLKTQTRLDDGTIDALLVYAKRECSYKEVAAVLGVSEQLIRSRIFRARRALGKLLASQE